MIEGMVRAKFHEFFVLEHNRPDYRLAKAILKYRPDILFLEMGSPTGDPDTIFNRHRPDKKPLPLVREIQKGLRRASKEFGYAKSNILMWDNIVKLWREGHQLLVFNTDAPDDLRREFFEVWKNMYPSATKNWLWWVRIYLRERYMERNIRWALNHYRTVKQPIALVQFGGFHWRHVKFLLGNPPKEKIWKYYFGKFPEINRKNIAQKIKKENKLFYRYWRKISGF
jgi:hypothetical protein